MYRQTLPVKGPWYSFLGGRPTDAGDSFYDSSKFQWTTSIISRDAEIRKEIIQLVEEERSAMPIYFNKSLVEAGTKWKTFSFMFWGLKFRKNMKRCPVTVSVLSKIPGVVSFSVSMLEKGSRIKPHRGDTDAIIRCHLPVSIPGKLPENGFRAGTETREWKEGELLLFNDSEEHEAWNLSDKDRIILIIDVIRPEFLHMKNIICRNVLSGLLLQYISSPSFLKWIYKKRSIRLFTQKILSTLLKPILPLVTKLS